MSAPHADQIINGYLARLKQAVNEARVPTDRGREIVDDIERHISEARASFADETDADLLNLIDRLGDPAAIVADDRQKTTGTAAARTAMAVPSAGLMEIASIVLTVLFWPVGIALVMASTVWTRREKRTVVALLALTFLLPFIVFPLVFGVFLGGGVAVGHLWFSAIPLSFLLAPVAAIYLAIRLGRHRTLTTA